MNWFLVEKVKDFLISLQIKYKLKIRKCAVLSESVMSLPPDWLPCELVNAAYTLYPGCRALQSCGDRDHRHGTTDRALLRVQNMPQDPVALAMRHLKTLF